MKKLYIHIGTGKTGTTSIQSTLYNSREYLRACGVKYADSGRNGINHHALCFNSFAYRTGRLSKEHLKSNFDKLRQELKVTNCERIVVSSEDYPGLDSAEVSELINYFSDLAEVHVIVYLRRQDLFLESWYAQIIKAGEIQSEISVLQKELERENFLDYYSLVERWSDKLSSKSHIHVRPFERSSFYNQDIVLDFLNLMGVTNVKPNLLDRDGVDENVALTRVQIEIVKALYSIGIEPKSAPDVLIPYEGFDSHDKVYLSEVERKSLMEKYNASNQELAKKYVGVESNAFFSDNTYPCRKVELLQSKIDFILQALSNDR